MQYRQHLLEYYLTIIVYILVMKVHCEIASFNTVQESRNNTLDNTLIQETTNIYGKYFY